MYKGLIIAVVIGAALLAFATWLTTLVIGFHWWTPLLIVVLCVVVMSFFVTSALNADYEAGRNPFL